MRFLPAVPGYVYAQKDNNLFVNLFINSTTSLTINNKSVEVIQQNNYPWDGDLSFTINPKSAAEFGIMMRLPGWAQNEEMPSDLYSFQTKKDDSITIKINGEPVNYAMQQGYAVLNRKWHKGDKIEVVLPMPVRKVVANNKVKDDIGKVALQRGPIMYCAEWVDNNGKASNIIIPQNTTFNTGFKPDVLNGVEELTATVPVVDVDTASNSVKTVEQKLTAIPYYAWANRGKGEMMLWFPESIKDVDIIAHTTATNP